jgi:predicted small secreted protein
MSTVRKLICCLVLLSTLCLFAGCNTVEGAGKDIEKAGKGIQKAAD